MGEHEELVSIYVSRGLDALLAEQVAGQPISSEHFRNNWHVAILTKDQKPMTWIDEMFVNIEADLAAASAKRTASTARAKRTEHLKEQIPSAPGAWSALVSTIRNDVSEFNKHKKRAGQTAVRVSQRGFHCEVYLPGMHGKRMVLTLANNDLQVLVHPEFPKQPLCITNRTDSDGQHGFWVLGEPAKEGAKQSVQQLSEYLLKPILASADISREQ